MNVQDHDMLVQFICSAPPCPIGYLEYENIWEKGVQIPRTLPHAERQARWRLEYAIEQTKVLKKHESDAVPL